MESLQEEATASPGYTVVFKKEDFSPLPEDPWKPLPITKLPDDFKRMLRKKNGVKKDGVEAFFLKLEMKDEKSNPTLQRTDDYIYDPSIRIGSGDGGVVYLGRHSPSQRYVALKAVKAFNSNPEEQEDYCGWKQAGRLFACYKKPMGSYSTFLLYIPLVIGETLAEIQDSREFMKNLGIENKGSGKIKEISYSQWEINQRLLQSFVEEYKFCKKKRQVLRILRYDSCTLFKSTSETTTSPCISILATHKRNPSVPILSIICCGATTFPKDFDILRPLSSTVYPCVTIVFIHAAPSKAILVNKEL